MVFGGIHNSEFDLATGIRNSGYLLNSYTHK